MNACYASVAVLGCEQI